MINQVNNRINLRKNGVPTFLFILASFLLIILSSLILSTNSSPPTKVLAANYDLDAEMFFWENIIHKYPTYVDGLVRLSFLEIQRGNITKAQNYLLMALKLNPNAKSVIEAKKTLGL